MKLAHTYLGLALATLAMPAAAQTTPAPAPATSTTAVDPAVARKMQWFADAKLGIFIHWGIYAVNDTSESWSFFNGQTTHGQYMAQRKGFTASKYDPAAWAALIKKSGARYAVLTSRHHDGVALWNSKEGLNVVRDTPARRDLIAPFAKALRDQQLKVGLYYSLPDWSNPGYDVFTRKEKRYDIAKEPAKWQRYLGYYQDQLRDIADRYNPDLYWLDGDWEHSAEEWQAAKVRQMLLAHNPNAIINSRLAGHGDYATPEQGLPIQRPAAPYWELCLTMNMSWGYRPSDTDYKTPQELIRIFADAVSNGGNLLLGIGPKQDGTIDAPQVRILDEFARWNAKHGEAVFGTVAGIPRDYAPGPSTLSPDRRKLYLFLDYRPNQSVVVKGLKNKVLSARVVGSNAPVAFKEVGRPGWSKVPGLMTLTIPEASLDPTMTVVALELDGPIDLFKDEVKPIDSN